MAFGTRENLYIYNFFWFITIKKPRNIGIYITRSRENEIGAKDDYRKTDIKPVKSTLDMLHGVKCAYVEVKIKGQGVDENNYTRITFERFKKTLGCTIINDSFRSLFIIYHNPTLCKLHIKYAISSIKWKHERICV
jgi:hypothetical protein